MLNELSIKVNIADRFYPLKVDPKQEEIIRQAAQLINQKIKLLQQQFGGYDKQDMLSMAILEITSELLMMKQQGSEVEQGITKEMEEIQQLLKQITL